MIMVYTVCSFNFLCSFLNINYVEKFDTFHSRAVIGEIDDDTDGSLDFPNIKAEPLNSVVH